MISGERDIVLYHAGYAPVETIDLSACRKVNDFGQGFYLTTDREQAERFVKTSILKSGQDLETGYVNMYRLSDFEGLKCHEFTTTNEEWLHCVCSFRRTDLFPHGTGEWEAYDVIIGKIANDDTMTTLTIYLQNGYGEVGSEEAVSTAIKTLKPERLRDQVCLKSELSLSKIEFVKAYEAFPK